MKRSEMILDISSELIREELNFPSFDKAQIVAEYILNRIEKEGMQPPFAEFKPIDYSGPGFLPPKTIYSNKWEPENE